MRLLAIDPGGTTGFAYAKDNRIQVRGEIPVDQYPQLWRLLGNCDPQELICEEFENIGNPAADISPKEVIGIVRLWGKLRCRPVHMQRATEVMAFWSDDKLQVLKLYMPGSPHANDATRHMLNHITFARGDQQYLMALRPFLHTM